MEFIQAKYPLNRYKQFPKGYTKTPYPIEINLECAVRYIEMTTGQKLFDFQKQLLNNIINGKITDSPRACGKSFVIYHYCNFLDCVHNVCKYDSNVNATEYISGDNVVNSYLVDKDGIKRSLIDNLEKTKKEYNIEHHNIFFDENAFQEMENS